MFFSTCFLFFSLSNRKKESSWLILICLVYSDIDASLCAEGRKGPLKPYQKVNRIPGLRNTFGRKDSFCSTLNQVRQVPCKFKSLFSLYLAFYLPYFSSSCDVLSRDREDFRSAFRRFSSLLFTLFPECVLK